MRTLLPVLGALTLLAAAPAGAAVSCTFNAGAKSLSVTATADGDGVGVYRNGTTIGVADDEDNIVACAGGSPTTTTIDTIAYTDASAGGDTLFMVNARGGSFTPGTVGEGMFNSSEIEITAAMGSGTLDVVHYYTPTTAASIRIGSPGAGQIALNHATGELAADQDLLVTGGERFVVLGEAGNDQISAQGGSGTGAAAADEVYLYGRDGDDTLTGGDGGDFLDGEAGNDAMHGQGGDDTIEGGAGDDTFDGGTGSDQPSFRDTDVGVTVDLAIAGPQTTGLGNDTLVAVEELLGSTGADVLKGTTGADTLDGAPGNDLLIGRGGDDVLRGVTGVDTIDFSAAPAGVSLDLATTSEQATGGAGTVRVFEIENLIGTPYADSLVGDADPNRIDAGGGADQVGGRGGDDLLLVRDGLADEVGCGDGNDTVVADVAGLDALLACEIVDHAETPVTPAPPPADAGGEGGGGTSAPAGGGGPATDAAGCLKRLRFAVKVPRGLRGVRARLDGRRLKVRRGRVRVDLRRAAPGVHRLRFTGRDAARKRVSRTRRLRVCA